MNKKKIVSANRILKYSRNIEKLHKMLSETLAKKPTIDSTGDKTFGGFSSNVWSTTT